MAMTVLDTEKIETRCREVRLARAVGYEHGKNGGRRNPNAVPADLVGFYDKGFQFGRRNRAIEQARQVAR